MKYTGIAGLLSVVILLSITAVSKGDLTYPNFASTSGLNLAGSAIKSGDKLQLVPGQPSQTGAAWTQDRQSLGSGFQTTFRVQATNFGGALDAGGKRGFDNFAFGIQNIGNNMQRVPDYDGTNPRVWVYFGQLKHANSSDVSSSFLRILHNGVVLQECNLDALGIAFRDQAVHQANVAYANQTLTVLVDNVPVAGLSGFDLSAMGLGNSYVGFQAYCGNAAYAKVDVLSWSMQSVPEPATLLLLGLGGMVLRRKNGR